MPEETLNVFNLEDFNIIYQNSVEIFLFKVYIPDLMMDLVWTFLKY